MTAAPADLTGLPPGERGLPSRRRALGLAGAAVLLPALTFALVAGRGGLDLGSVLLLYLLAVVILSLVGGLAAGVVAAVAAFLLANFYLTPPYHTFIVEGRDSIVALVVFLGVGVTVSGLVDVAARRQAEAVRSAAEAAVLGRVAGEPLTARTPEEVLAEVAAAFGLTSVRLVQRGTSDVVLAQVGPGSSAPGTVEMPAGDERYLLGDGPELFAEDRRLLASLARAASRAVDVRLLAGEASRARELAEVDRLRSALLAAVGHDLRTPLAGIKAAVTTLRQPELSLSETDRAELLGTVEHSADRLADVLANLLDLSRLQAQAVRVELAPVAVDEVVARALLDRHGSDVVNDVPDDLPYGLADAGLLERVVANLVDNAQRHSPPGRAVRVSGDSDARSVTLAVVDHGPGVPEEDWERMFLAFQRLDDRRADAGVGLGLAIARGFSEAMGATVRPEHTPGGGLTMRLTLPRAPEAAGERVPS